jgi:hypothetical protein
MLCTNKATLGLTRRDSNASGSVSDDCARVSIGRELTSPNRTKLYGVVRTSTSSLECLAVELTYFKPGRISKRACTSQEPCH